MLLNYQDRTMRFEHEQELMRVLRFMFGHEVGLSALRENDQEAFRYVFAPSQEIVATVYFDPGEEF